MAYHDYSAHPQNGGGRPGPYDAYMPKHAHQPPISSYSTLGSALSSSNHNPAPPLPTHDAYSYSPSAFAHGQALAPHAPPASPPAAHPHSPPASSPAPGRRRSSVSDPAHKRRSSAASSSRRSSKHASASSASKGQDASLTLCGGGTRVPQPRIPSRSRLGAIYPPILFYRPSRSAVCGARPGVRLRNGVPFCGDIPFFPGIPDRLITLVFHWPGYPRPFHVTLTHAYKITMRDVLERIAKAFLDFVKDVEAHNIEVSPGQQCWSVTRRADGSEGIQVTDLVAVCLVHVSSSEWQPILEVVSE